MRVQDRAYPFPREKPVVHTGDETLTQQHHAKAADLNEIVRRFGISGKNLPPAVDDPRYYGDFSDVPDFQTALDRVNTAQDHFERLPSGLRERFANDPIRLHNFVMAPENAEEAVRLGLLHKRALAPEPSPIVTPPTTPTV